jgi:hypothetical protein
LFLMFLLTTGAGIALFGLRYSLFDRYLWPIVPTLAILFLHVPTDLEVVPEARVGGDAPQLSSQAVSGAVIAGAVLAGVAIVYLVNAHAFDVGRWRAGETLQRLGIPADRIDAGYEWMGYHARVRATVPTAAAGPTSYRDLWPEFQLCGLVSSIPQPAGSGDLVGTVTYELNLVAGPAETLYLYRNTSPDCAVGAD